MANLRANRITSTEVFETTGSVQFDGSGDYLSIADQEDLDLGTGDFTIEFFAYANTSSLNDGYISKRTTGTFATNNQWRIAYYDTEDNINLIHADNTSFTAAAAPAPGNNWAHYAFVRQSGTMRVFKDGIKYSETTGYTYDFSNTYDLLIGANVTSDLYFDGHISNVRILKGQALYTTNFTPPTRELEVIPNTVLLACQSTTKADEEKTGKTITVNGNAVANELTPGLLTSVVKSGGSSAITGSVEFDGTGDCLTAPDGSDFEFGSDNFTIEAYIYYTGSPGTGGDTYVITSKWDNQSAPNDKGLILRISDDGSGDNLQWFYTTDGSTNDITTGSTILIPESWYHIAFVRNGTVGTFYINGISDVTTVSFGSDSIRDTGNPFRIGANLDSGAIDQEFQGFISNLRVIKGTALYTSNFIPPTRKLTKLPGTVLLCCQDSNDPLTEETGKTITGYGDLQKADGVELSVGTWTDSSSGTGSGSGTDSSVSITGVDLSNRGALYLSKTVEIGKQYVFSWRTTSSWNNAKFGVDSNDGTNDVIDAVSNDPDYIYITGAIASGLKYREVFTARTTTAVLYFQEAGNSTSTADQISLQLYEPPNRASNFTPQVGSDGSVEFAGPTTINTENYFYLPTGDTESRTLNVATQASSSARGVFMGGLDSAPTAAERDVIDYITIASSGNAVDFGNLTAVRRLGGACSSATRGISLGGFNSPVIKNEIEYITISSTGDAKDFGDLIEATRSNGGLANSTRGISFGGVTPSTVNNIEYVTIATTGTAKNFGDLVSGSGQSYGTASPTRGVIGGGETPSLTNTIQYVTIATMGNALDFGDLSAPRSGIVAFSNSTRGCFAGGEESPGFVNTIDYVTISTTANSLNFGDLNNTNGLRLGGSASSPTRGIYASGGNNTPVSNTSYSLIHMVTINSTGDSIDFGDITVARYQILNGTVSSGHGGLG